MNSEVVEQFAGVTGVLGGDQVDLLEDPQGAEGDVLEVADRGGDDVEGPGGGVFRWLHDGSEEEGGWIPRLEIAAIMINPSGKCISFVDSDRLSCII